jgi:hypothetical protein
MDIGTNSSLIINLLWAHASHLPLYLTWVAGIILAAGIRDQYPRAGVLLISGLSVALIATLAVTSVQAWLPTLLVQQGANITQISLFIGVVGMLSALIQAAAWGLVIAAAMVGRRGSA